MTESYGYHYLFNPNMQPGIGTLFRRFFLLVLFVNLSGCTHFTPPPPSAASMPAATPTRLLVIMTSGITPKDIESGALPYLSQLRKSTLYFPNARVGELTAHTVVSLPAFTTGLWPRHLPWQDRVWKDVRGELGRRDRFFQIDELSAATLKRLMEPPYADSLSTRWKIHSRGEIYSVAPSQIHAVLFGGPSAEVFSPSKVAEAALSLPTLECMRSHPDWRGLFVYLGEADPNATANPLAQDEAIEQIIGELAKSDLLSETLIAVTATHGAQAKPMLATALSPILSSPNVEYAAADSIVRVWLKKKDRVSIARFAAQLRQISGVAEIYTKQPTGKSVHYIRAGRRLSWAGSQTEELVATLPSPGSPEILVLLEEGYRLGKGEEGGAQDAVQTIPLFLRAPNLNGMGTEARLPITLVDLNAIISRLLHLPVPESLDGTAEGIEGWFRNGTR